jgi:hypothetical protein
MIILNESEDTNLSFSFLFPNETINDFLYLLHRVDHRKHQQEIYKIGYTNKCKSDDSLDTQITSVCPADNESNIMNGK